MCDARSRRALLAFVAALLGVAGVRAQDPQADWRAVEVRPDVIVNKETGKEMTGRITKIANKNIYIDLPDGRGEYVSSLTTHQVEYRDGVTNADALVRVGRQLLDEVNREVDDALPDTTSWWTLPLLKVRAAHGAEYLKRVHPDAGDDYALAVAAKPGAYTPAQVADRLEASLTVRGRAVERGRRACGDLAGAVAERDFARATRLAADADRALADPPTDPAAARVAVQFRQELKEIERVVQALAAEDPETDPSRTEPTRLAARARQLAREKEAAGRAAGLRLPGRPVAEAFAAHRDAAIRFHATAAEFQEASAGLADVVASFERYRGDIASAPPADRTVAERRLDAIAAELDRVRAAATSAPPGAATEYTRRHLEAFARRLPADRLTILLRLDAHLAADAADRVNDRLTLEAAVGVSKELETHRAGFDRYRDDELTVFQLARKAAVRGALTAAATDCRGVVAARQLEGLTRALAAVAARAAAVRGVGAADDVVPLREAAARVVADLEGAESQLATGVAALGGEPARVAPVAGAIGERLREARHARDLLRVWEAVVVPPDPRTLAELEAGEAAVAQAARDLPAAAFPTYDGLRARAEGAVRARAERLTRVRPGVVFDHGDATVGALLDAAAAHLGAERLSEGRVTLVDAGDRARDLGRLSSTYPRLRDEPFPGRVAVRVARHAELGSQADRLAAQRRRAAGWHVTPVDGAPLVPPSGVANRLRAELLAGLGRPDEAGPSLSAEFDARVRFEQAVAREAGGDWGAAAEAYREAVELAPGRPIAAAADAARVRALARARSERDDSSTLARVGLAAAAALGFVAVAVGVLRLGSARATSRPGPPRPATAPAPREASRLTPAAADLPAVVRYAVTLPLTAPTGDFCLGWLEKGSWDKKLRADVFAWLRRELADCRGKGEAELRWAADAAARCERLLPARQWPLVCRVRILAALGDDAAAILAVGRVRPRGLNPADALVVLSARATGLLRLGRYREVIALLTPLRKRRTLPPDGERWLAVARAGLIGADPGPGAQPDPKLVARLLQDIQ